MKNEFLIIPTHPLDRDAPEILSYEEGFRRINWEILDRERRDYHQPEIKKACMAECDINLLIPPEAFRYVYLYDQTAYRQLLELPQGRQFRNKLVVNPNMFPNYERPS